MSNEEKIISMLEALTGKVEALEKEVAILKAALKEQALPKEGSRTCEEDLVATGIDILRMKF